MNISIYNNWGTTKPSDRACLGNLLDRTDSSYAFPHKKGFLSPSERQMIQKFISRDLIVKVPNGAMKEIDFGLAILTLKQQLQVKNGVFEDWWVWNPIMNYGLDKDYLRLINRLVKNYNEKKEKEVENLENSQYKLSI